MCTQIVIPLHHGGGRFGDDTELRFALRAWSAHFQGDFRISIAGAKLPAWAQGNIRHIQSGDLKDALRRTADTYPDGFVWTYDDSLPVRPVDAASLKFIPCSHNWGGRNSAWEKMLWEIRDRLEKEGHVPRNYSLPHGPYWFDKSMVDEGFADWPDMHGKFPWETWILSKRRAPRRYGVIRWGYGKSVVLDPLHHFVNYSNEGMDQGLPTWMRGLFPVPSPWENPNVPLAVAPPKAEPEKRKSPFTVELVRVEPVPAVRQVFPDAPTGPRQKIEIHSLRYGNPPWMRECAMSMNAWVARHDLPLYVWGGAGKEFPHPKFQMLEMLRSFLERDNDWFFFVDADTLFHTDAPVPFFPAPGHYASRDYLGNPISWRAEWDGWCQKNLGEAAESFYTYTNAGVWACDREAARSILAVAAPPYFYGIMDQHQWNWWIYKAICEEGLVTREMPGAWHSFSLARAVRPPGWLYHFNTGNKPQSIANLKKLGLLGDPQTLKIPEPVYGEEFTQRGWRDGRHKAALVRVDPPLPRIPYAGIPTVLFFPSGRFGNHVLTAMDGCVERADLVTAWHNRWLLGTNHPYGTKLIPEKNTPAVHRKVACSFVWRKEYEQAKREVGAWLLEKPYAAIDCIAVHVRLGDQFQNPHNPRNYVNPEASYFRQGVAEARAIVGDLPVLLFSDEPDRAVELYGLGDYIVVRGRSAWQDWQTMARCRAVICSDSTFSGTAAALSTVCRYAACPAGAFNVSCFPPSFVRLPPR